jgi:hypothetical protein
LARYQAVILNKSLKEVQSGASYKQGVKSKAAIPQIPGPPKVKPYVADVIPENTFKIPKMMLSSRQRFIEETKIFFKTNSKIANVRYRDGAFVDGDRIRIYVNYKVVAYEALLDGDFKVWR